MFQVDISRYMVGNNQLMAWAGLQPSCKLLRAGQVQQPSGKIAETRASVSRGQQQTPLETS
jgi:hypothetical protein